MSLIAYTLNYGKPAIIGDLLTTSEDEGSVLIPTIQGDAREAVKATNGVRSHEMRQKIYVLRPDMCIALAGNVYEMSLFLKEIKIYCSYSEAVSKTSIEKFLSIYDLDRNFQQSSFLILINERGETGDFKINHLKYGEWVNKSTKLFEDSFVCGTGCNAFSEHMSKLDIQVGGSIVNDSLYHAIANNVRLLTRIMVNERISLNTILNEWGAGFELIYLDKDSFLKLDNISYLITTGEINKSDVSFTPKRLMHYKYYGDFLCVYAFEINSYQTEYINNTVVITCKDYQVFPFIIKPVDGVNKMSRGVLPDLFFQTDKVAVGQFIEVSNEQLINSYFTKGDTTHMKYNHQEGIKIVLPAELYKSYSSTIRLTYTGILMNSKINDEDSPARIR